MANSKIPAPIVHREKTNGYIDADIYISSHNNVCDLMLKSSDPNSWWSPSVSLNIKNDGTILVYADTGNGFQLVRTI